MGILSSITNAVTSTFKKLKDNILGTTSTPSTPVNTVSAPTTPVAPLVPKSTLNQMNMINSVANPSTSTSSTTPTETFKSNNTSSFNVPADNKVSTPSKSTSSSSTNIVNATEPVANTNTSSNQDVSRSVNTTGMIPKVDINGNVVGYEKPTPKTYYEQTGKYQFDLTSPEGVQERVDKISKDIPYIIADVRDTAAPILAYGVTNPQLAAAALTEIGLAYQSVSTYLASSAKIGQMATTTAGAKTLAGASQAAAGIVDTGAIAEAGTVAVNSKTAATSIGFLAKLGIKDLSLGTVLKVGGLTGIGLSVKDKLSGGNPEAVSKMNNYIKESDDLQQKLRDIGMDDLADELLDTNKDLYNDFKSITPYLPFVGTNIEKNKIEQFSYDLDKMNNKYEKMLKEKTQKAAAEAQAAKDAQSKADEIQKAKDDAAKLAESRAYNEAQRDEQRRYNEQQKADERAYNIQQQLDANAIATESTGGSNLQFGLLSSSGAKEFVDKDKAAQYYFGKVYNELTPAQQMLMNLMKDQKE